MIILRKAEQISARLTTEPLTTYATRFERDYAQFQGRFIQLTELYEHTLYGAQKLKEADYIELLKPVAQTLTKLKKNKK